MWPLIIFQRAGSDVLSCPEPIDTYQRECLRSLGHSASHAGFKCLGNFRGRRPLKEQLLSILYKSHRQATAINAHKNETRSTHLSSNQFAKLSHFEE